MSRNRSYRSKNKDSKPASEKSAYDIFPDKSTGGRQSGNISTPFIVGTRNKAIQNNCNLPWVNTLGDPIDISTQDGTKGQISVPGVLALTAAFGPGYSDHPSSPLNVAARNIKTFVDAANSRVDNTADAPDYMLYILQLTSCYAFHMHLSRAYYFARNFKFFNRYTPEVLLTAMGIDAQSMRNNLPQFRNSIEIFVDQIGTFPLPNNIDYTQRVVNLFSKVYKDAKSAKAQLMLNIPAGFYHYDQTGMYEHEGGQLIWTPWNKLYARACNDYDNPSLVKEKYTVEQLQVIMEWMADVTTQSQDLRYIGANIQKAYGNSLWEMNKLSLDDHSEFNDSEESEQFKLLMHNATMCGHVNAPSMTVYQVIEEPEASIFGSKLYWMPYIEQTQTAKAGYRHIIEGNQLVDTWQESPSPEDVALMCAGKPCLESTGDNGYAVKCADFFYTLGVVWTLRPDGGVQKSTFTSFHSTTASYLTFDTLYYITKFDWAPMVTAFRLVYDGSNYNLDAVEVIGDLDNYTYVSNDQLETIARASSFGMWAVPEEAFYQN